MKVLQQLKLGDKVKLKLEQPQFKCSGRSEVECFYRGIVSDVYADQYLWITFKYKGEEIEAQYNLYQNRFNWDELKDIKII